MALPGEIGWIGKTCPDHPHTKLATRTIHSGAGWFVATQCPQCSVDDPSPHSRESHYYTQREDCSTRCGTGPFAGATRRFTRHRWRLPNEGS